MVNIIEKLHTVNICISRCSKTAKIKLLRHLKLAADNLNVLVHTGHCNEKVAN